jgi:hypothetical protein
MQKLENIDWTLVKPSLQTMIEIIFCFKKKSYFDESDGQQKIQLQF